MLPSLTGKGILIDGIVHLSPAEAMELISEGAVLVDIREDFERELKTFDVEHIIWCPSSVIAVNSEALPRDRLLILADCVGLHSKEAIRQLEGSGFLHLANLNGGIADWERDGLPVSQDDESQLSGQCPCQLKPIKRVRK
jgi:rhodanese-related sulfurtransferase